MYKQKLIVLLSLLLALAMTGCATEQPSSPPPYIAPTVNCEESSPAAKLPEYPSTPPEWTVASLKAFISAQYNWAIGAIDSYSSVKADRKSTAECLNKLRAKGVIN